MKNQVASVWVLLVLIHFRRVVNIMSVTELSQGLQHVSRFIDAWFNKSLERIFYDALTVYWMFKEFLLRLVCCLSPKKHSRQRVCV
jgi:hypothetical protein